tara:strand:+ start:507 stop:1514 length:1008 start_codon:yes stop_codon:yes gene_type:complete
MTSDSKELERLRDSTATTISAYDNLAIYNANTADIKGACNADNYDVSIARLEGTDFSCSYFCDASGCPSYDLLNNAKGGILTSLWNQISTASTAKGATTAAYINQKAASNILEAENQNTNNIINSLKKVEKDKLRMVQINDYYSKRYQAETKTIKKVIIILCVFLILTILAYKKIISVTIVSILAGLLLFIALGIVISDHRDMDSRDKLIYDEYDWGSNIEVSDMSDASCADSSNQFCYLSTGAADLSGKWVDCSHSGSSIITNTNDCNEATDSSENVCEPPFTKLDADGNLVEDCESPIVDNFTVIGRDLDPLPIKTDFKEHFYPLKELNDSFT